MVFYKIDETLRLPVTDMEVTAFPEPCVLITDVAPTIVHICCTDQL